MNPPTSANTAQQSATTAKTSATAIAGTAISLTTQRIDSFIKQKLKEAKEGSASGLSDSANKAAQLGFVNAANVRYSKFLDAFLSSPRLTEMYAEKYPSCLFLPWSALHAVIASMDLWVDLPEFYQGAVPAEQIPWMEIFELGHEDKMNGKDVSGLLTRLSSEGLAFFNDSVRDHARGPGVFRLTPAAETVVSYWQTGVESLFVVAPKEAFSSKVDWLTRFHALIKDASTVNRVAPDDPLVIRFCRGGALVVASWGDEAAYINEIARELKI